MKKLLALVLALVMTLSLCITTNAAYPDAADVDYKEAVDVMSSVGVFKGDEKGNFNPDANLTRETAAKLIAYLDLGEKVAEALPAVKVFSDVEANRWSAKYIAYCADAGYIAGTGDGSYNPTGELTGYAFGKLLLCVLGYDANIEGFTGANWSIAVAKFMQANDIAKGVDKAGSAVLTREEAAQYCLNALKADCVEYADKGTQISINGATIATGASKAEAVENKKADDYRDASADQDEVQQLIEKLYPDVTLYTTSESDAYGRPAIVWDNDGDEIGTYGDTADYTFVIDEDTTVADLIADEKLTKKITDLNGFGSDDLYVGAIVELFVDDGVLEDVVAYDYYVDTIVAVRELDEGNSADKDAVKDGATYELELDNMGYLYDIQIANFDAKTYVEDAVVTLVYVYGEGTLCTEKDFDELGTEYVYLDTAVADSFTGKVTAGASDYFKVDGTKYVIGDEFYSLNGSFGLGKEGTFYTDPNGYVIGFAEKDEDTSADIKDVLFAVDSYKVEETDKFGTLSVKYYIQAVGVDGTVQEILVAKNSAVNPDSDITLDSGAYKADYPVFTAKELKKGDYKGTFEITAYSSQINDDYYWDTINVSGLEADDTKCDGYRLNSKTSYINIEDSLADIDVTVKNGGVTIKTAPSTAIAIYSQPSTSNYLAAYVFMTDAATKDSTKSDEIVYVDSTLVSDTMEYTTIGEDDDAAYTFDVYTLKGTTKNITVLSSDIGSITPDAFYAITEIEKDGNVVLDDSDIASYVVDDTTGAAYGVAYAGCADDEIITAMGDIDTSKAVFVDVHDQDASGEYGRTVKTVAAMEKAYDKGAGYTTYMNIYGDEDTGAVIIFITSVQ